MKITRENGMAKINLTGAKSSEVLIGIVMGSDSDLPVMAKAAEILDELLTKWEDMGYRFASLDELFARQTEAPDAAAQSAFAGGNRRE